MLKMRSLRTLRLCGNELGVSCDMWVIARAYLSLPALI